MAATSYTPTALYGGAITADLPSDLLDVSEIRQVPDHQEVRLQRAGTASVVVDVLERVGPPSHAVTSDEAALHYHYADVVAAGHTRADVEGSARAERTRVLSAARVVVPGLGGGVPVWTMAAVQRPVQPEEGKEGEVGFVGIFLAVVRLEAQKTDLVVAVNVPHVAGEFDPATVDFEAGRVGPLMEMGMEWQGRILRSLKVVDWGLFVDEE